MSFSLGATDVVVRQFGEPESASNDLILLTTRRGYTVAIDDRGLFHLVRDGDGRPVLGGFDEPIVDPHVGTAEFNVGFVAGLVLCSGRVVRKNRVPGHVMVDASRSNLIAHVVAILEKQASGAKAKTGKPFPVGTRAVGDRVEIASRYINLLAGDGFDDLGNDFDVGLVEQSPSRWAGFLAGVVAASQEGGVTIRSQAVARYVHARLAQDWGVVSTLTIAPWSPELHTARNENSQLPRLVFEAVSLARLRRKSTFLAEILPDVGLEHVANYHVDEIVSAKAVKGPAIEVGLRVGQVLKVGGFIFAGVELGEDYKARTKAFLDAFGAAP